MLPEFILSNLAESPTIYDPALAESDPRTRHRGGTVGVRRPVCQQLAVGKDRHAGEHQSQLVSIGEADISEHDIGKFQAELSKVDGHRRSVLFDAHRCLR